MSKNATLMHRADEKIALWQLLAETGGELNDTLEAWLSEVEKNLQVKLDSYKFAQDELGAEAERLRLEAQSLMAAARSIDNVKSALNDRIKQAMYNLKTNEICGEKWRFKLSRTAPRLVLQPEILPDTFKIVKTSYEPDKERIKTHLELGEKIEGACLEEVNALRVYVNKGN